MNLQIPLDITQKRTMMYASGTHRNSLTTTKDSGIRMLGVLTRWVPAHCGCHAHKEPIAMTTATRKKQNRKTGRKSKPESAIVQVIANGYAKVGEGNDLRGLRYDHAQKLVVLGDDGEAVNLNDSVVYRFPWPLGDEERTDLRGFDSRNYDHGGSMLLAWPEELDRFPFANGLMQHHHLQLPIRTCELRKRGSKAWPCPMDNPKPDEPQIISIFGERRITGKPITVFRCGYCDMLFTLSVRQVKVFSKRIATLHRAVDNCAWRASYLREIGDLLRGVGDEPQIVEGVDVLPKDWHKQPWERESER
jgi:hypothetical protein